MKNEELIKKYPDAKCITLLNRKKITNISEKLIDAAVYLFTPAAGIIEEADMLSDLGAYFLVENQDNSLLIRVAKNEVTEIAEITSVTGKTFDYDGNRFRKSLVIKK